MILALWCVRLATADPAWWLALKTPRGHTAAYDYADSRSPWLVPRYASHSIYSLLQEVMGHYYFAKECDACGMGLLEWNDQAPRRRKRYTGPQPAHAKGFLVVHAHGAFLLTHSAPRFPMLETDFDAFYPGNALQHAQHFFYAELSSAAVELFAEEVLLYLWPKVQNARMADNNGILGRTYPSLSNIIRNHRRGIDWKKRAGISRVNLPLSDGTQLVVVTKPAGQQKSIYEHTAGIYGPILVQTWLRGSEKELSSPLVRRVCTIASANGAQWFTSNDHSKYFVSKNAGNHFVGIGDLNRQFTQWDRGGSLFILGNQHLSQSLRSRTIVYDQTCAEANHVCTPPMMRDPSKDNNVCKLSDDNECRCRDDECCTHPSISTSILGSCLNPQQACLVGSNLVGFRRSLTPTKGVCVLGVDGLKCVNCQDNDAGLQSASGWSRYSCAASTIYCRKYQHARTHCRNSCHVCKCRDDDAGLQSKWGSTYRCASSANYCRTYAKIMWGLCPETCHICNCQDDDVGLAHHWAGYTCASSTWHCSGYANIMHVYCRKSCQVCDSPPAIIHDELRKKRSAAAEKCPMESNCAEVSSPNAPCAVVIGDMSWTAWDEVYGVWVKDHCVLHAYEQRDFHGAYQEFYPGPHAFASRSMRSIKCACGVCAYAQLPNNVAVSNSSQSMAINGFHVTLECAPGYVLVGSQPRATVCDVDGAPYNIELAEGCAPYGA